MMPYKRPEMEYDIPDFTPVLPKFEAGFKGYISVERFFNWIDTIESEQYKTLKTVIKRVKKIKNAWYIRDLISLLNVWQDETN